MKPFCFVLMPFGQKSDGAGRTIDFDRIYSDIFKPAIKDADLEPIRADEEAVGGFIHKPMFERLMLCDYAIADLTTANANVLYELGIRHGVRPHSTVLTFCKGTRLPFDVAPLRGLPYGLTTRGLPEDADRDRKLLADRLVQCRNPVEDSPLFQLITDWPRPELARLKTDRFRELIEYSKKFKDLLAQARGKNAAAVSDVEHSINIADADPAIVIDLFLSYRSVEAWEEMVALVGRMPPLLARAVLVQEQLGLALNRLGRRDEAERTLVAIISEHGPSSETNGILGRVYKDLWREADASGQPSLLAQGYLRKSINCYVAGFEADWRDAYPGINAVALMELLEPVDDRQKALMPVVRYSVGRRLSGESADYWDYATLLELNVLERDIAGAKTAAENAIAATRERWEPKSTAGNLTYVADVRSRRGEAVEWIREIVRQLISRAAEIEKAGETRSSA